MSVQVELSVISASFDSKIKGVKRQIDDDIVPSVSGKPSGTAAQLLRSSNALTVSDDTITLFKGDGSSESVTINTNSITNNNQLTNGAGYQTSAQVNTAIQGIVDSAPGALNTLNELAAALGDDANFSATITDSIATKLPLTGGVLSGNLEVGATNKTSDTVVRSLAHQSYKAGFEAYGNDQGTGYFYAGQSTDYGGGFSYNGDGSPSFVEGESADKITFFNREAGTSREVFSYAYNNTRVDFNGSITVSGGDSGQWNTAYGWGNHANAGYLSTTGKAADSNLLDGIDSSAFLRSNTNDTFTGALTIDGYIKGNGQQLVLNAGEAHSYATGQTGEYIYLNAEQGLQINSSTGNWNGGWSSRKTAYLRGDQLTLDGETLTKANIQNFKTAHGWGNHAGLYLGTSAKAADSNLLDGLDLGGTRANVANKVVRTDGNGYLNTGWINTTSGNTTSTITDFYVNTNDGYIRKATKAHVKSQLGLGSAAYVATSTFDAAGAADEVNTRIDEEVLPAIPTNNNELTNGAGYLTSTNDRVYLTDSRGAARAPSYYNDRYAQWDFQNSNDTGAGGEDWHGLLTVSKWTGYNSSHKQEQLIFTGENLKRRTATSDSAWGSVKTIWDSGNLDAFVGATVSNDTITFTKANGGTIAVTTSDANSWRGIHDSPVNGATTTSISSNWAFDNVKTAVPANALFTDTNTQLTDAQVRSKFSAGTNVSISSAGVISATDTNTTYSTNTAYGTRNSGTQIRMNGGEIPSGANLDSYRTQGVFSQNSNSDATAGSNYPEDKAGILCVDDDMYGNGLHTAQTYYIYNSQNVYSRSYYNGSWTNWRNLAQDTNTTYSVGDGGLTQKNFTTTLKNKLDGIAAGATNVTNNNQLTNGAGYITSYVNTQRTNAEIREVTNEQLVAGDNVTLAVEGETIVISSTDTNTNTTYSAGTGLTLSGTTFSLSSTYDNYNGWDLYTDGTSRGRITTGENVNFAGGSNVSLSYSATNNTITINSTDTNTNTQRSDEEIRDVAAAQWVNGTNTTVVKDDANNTIKINSVNTNTQLTDAQVRSKFSAGSNVAISSAGVISATNTNTQRTNADIRGVTNEQLVAGDNVTLTVEGETIVISSTDTNTDTNTQRSDEEIRDVAAAQWVNGTNTTVVKDDANNTIKINSVNTNTQLTDAQVRSKFSAGSNVSISSAGVISATAGSDIDYEEGNWTPTLANGVTAQSKGAKYTKIGNTVHLSGYITGINREGVSGIQITNPPFNVNATSADQPNGSAYGNFINFEPGYINIRLLRFNQNMYFSIVRSGSNTASITEREITQPTAASLYFSITYKTF